MPTPISSVSPRALRARPAAAAVDVEDARGEAHGAVVARAPGLAVRAADGVVGLRAWHMGAL